jgi:hypothetical protein
MTISFPLFCLYIVIGSLTAMSVVFVVASMVRFIQLLFQAEARYGDKKD